jgi:hypothetical protein
VRYDLPLLLLAAASLAPGCRGRCGTLELGGSTGFSIFIGDLDREVPIEQDWFNRCPVKIDPVGPPNNAATGYLWGEDPGWWAEMVELVADVDHRNRQIDSSFSPYWWPAFRVPWDRVEEGATLDLTDGLVGAELTWENPAPNIDDVFLLDGQSVWDVTISWPVSLAELTIRDIRASEDACEAVTGELYLKVEYRMEAGPVDDPDESWAVLEGHDTFVVDDDFWCRDGEG